MPYLLQRYSATLIQQPSFNLSDFNSLTMTRQSVTIPQVGNVA